MIKTVEVFGVDFTVEFEAYGEQPSSLYDPGEPKYMDFESVTVNGIDIWKCLSQDCLDKIEEELWKEIER